MVMGQAEMHFDKEEDKNEFKNAPHQDKIKNYENDIKLVKTEKLLYNALGNPNSKRNLFPILLAKYDELMGLSYEISGKMVLNGIVVEGDYLITVKRV